MQRNEEQNGRAQLKFADRAQTVELSTEITLPDYRSEINKLLWVRPVFLPTSRFVGNGRIEFSGAVCYHILYVGADGALHGVDHEGSYDFSIPGEAGEGFEVKEGIEATAEVAPDAVISRVIGPRRLSVRCRLRTRVCGYAVKNLTPRLEGSEQDGVYRLCEAAENGRFAAGEPDSFRLEDEATVEQGQGELRLIAARGALMITDVGAAEDYVRCRGEAVVDLLLDAEEGDTARPFALTRRIPFDREVALTGAMPDWQAAVVGEIGSISATVEGNRIALEADVLLSAMGQLEESVLLHRDVYRPGFCADCHTVEETLWHSGFCGNRHFSVSGERLFDEINVPADATVLDAVADAEIKERQSEGGRTVLLGELRCHVLYCRLGEYETGEFSIPFRGILDEESDDAGLLCSVSACRVVPVGDGLRADAEIGIAAWLCRRQRVNCLASAVFTSAEAMPRADLEICYPAGDDSLWTVGKRYGVSPDALAAANGLSADGYGECESLAHAKYLLIP